MPKRPVASDLALAARENDVAFVSGFLMSDADAGNNSFGNGTMRRTKSSNPIPPASTGDSDRDTEINTEIALYNRSGNMLALWAVLGMCARAGVKLPEGVDERFATIAEQLLQDAEEGKKRARESVADRVLGTRKVKGGKSEFEKYALLKRNAAIVARVFEILMQDLKDLQNRRKVRPRRQSRKGRAMRGSRLSPPEAATQWSIYEQVAAEYDVDPATVKRLFEKEEREVGPFAYRVLQLDPGEDGIVDI